MARFVKGDVVVVPFPFSDLSQSKRRPALVLAQIEGNDRILCQITSQHVRDLYAIELIDSNFEFGSLKHKSNILRTEFIYDNNKYSRTGLGC
jgi:mRNA interferase MazF